MAFLTTILMVLAAGIVMVTVFIMTPFLYDIWYNNLRDQASSTYVGAGDSAFRSFMIMCYVVPGIIIIYGIAFASRKSVNESEVY